MGGHDRGKGDADLSPVREHELAESRTGQLSKRASDEDCQVDQDSDSRTQAENMVKRVLLIRMLMNIKQCRQGNASKCQAECHQVLLCGTYSGISQRIFPENASSVKVTLA